MRRSDPLPGEKAQIDFGYLVYFRLGDPLAGMADNIKETIAAAARAGEEVLTGRRCDIIPMA